MRKAMYAALGAVDLAVGTARSLGRKVRDPQAVREDVATGVQASRAWVLHRYQGAVKGYEGLVKRGRRLAREVNRSAPVRRAAEQTKRARSQVKGAATSVRKAVGSQAEATKAAAKKAG